MMSCLLGGLAVSQEQLIILVLSEGRLSCLEANKLSATLYKVPPLSVTNCEACVEWECFLVCVALASLGLAIGPGWPRTLASLLSTGLRCALSMPDWLEQEFFALGNVFNGKMALAFNEAEGRRLTSLG